MRPTFTLGLVTLLALGSASAAQGGIESFVKIGDSSGGSLPLGGLDHFGRAVDRLSDFDGDGIPDLLVGAPGDFHPAFPAYRGSVWILLMNADGSVRDEHVITPSDGGFVSSILGVDGFGASVAALGDIDSNGTEDIAVGSDDGRVWILRMGPNGNVVFKWELVGSTVGGSASFARSLEGLGDIHGDGVVELAVGDPDFEVGGDALGAVWIFTVLPPGFPVLGQAYTEDEMGFHGDLDDGDRFGRALARVGDVDGDGFLELAVGAPQDDDGGTDEGAVWILFFTQTGEVDHAQKISQTVGSMPGLPSTRHFGRTLGRLGDFDEDGTPELLIGAEPEPALDPHFWVAFLRTNGTLRTYLEYDAADVGSQGEAFPVALAALDLDGDGRMEVAVGAPNADGASPGSGAVYALSLEPVVTAAVEGSPCDPNPAGSLVATKGPALGQELELSLDNPLGTQLPGSLPVLGLSLFQAAGPKPCGGVPVPGWHMDPTLPAGSLMLGGPLLSLTTGAPWMGPPAVFSVPVPHDTSLIGLRVYVQGAIVDPIGQSPFIGLSQALAATIGV